MNDLINNVIEKVVCEQCGGTHLELKCWCDPNSGKVTDNRDCDAKQDRWCNDCQEHVYFIFEKEFLKNKEEDGNNDE